MKETQVIMGMPIEIEIVGNDVAATLEASFSYLKSVDEQFSPFKETSEVSRFNRGELTLATISKEMQEIFALAEKTKAETHGYFDIRHPDGHVDPSGVVKGWAIFNTAKLIRDAGFENYFVNAGGDIAMRGKNSEFKEWRVGIRNPLNIDEIVKVVYPHEKGIATSGSYIRGAHIYNPHTPEEGLHDIVSITVIGPDVVEADLLATAAFAIGKDGISFIEKKDGFEGYAIDVSGIATMTSGFAKYTEMLDLQDEGNAEASETAEGR
jgi:thiamine biosynthesis lipoprotein